jgi:hypothetical protein
MNAPETDWELELAREPLDPSDAALFNAIRALYEESDPVPSGLVERIQFQLTLDALQTEVATLMQSEFSTSGVRSGSATEAVRTVTFSSDSLTTMVTITPQPDRSIRIDGWAAPGAGLKVELLLPDGPRQTHADEDGRFVFDSVPPGLAKFVLYVAREHGPATVVSPTIQL